MHEFYTFVLFNSSLSVQSLLLEHFCLNVDVNSFLFGHLNVSVLEEMGLCDLVH